MRAIIVLFVALAVLFTFVPSSEGQQNCTNIAVYNTCMGTGQAQLSSCASDDWICKCSADKAIQNCYLQCPDDPGVQASATANQPAAQQACSLAASQSSAKATATPTAATTPAAQSTITSAPPTQAAATPTTSASPTASAKSLANNNKINAVIAAVPPVAAFMIGQFI